MAPTDKDLSIKSANQCECSPSGPTTSVRFIKTHYRKPSTVMVLPHSPRTPRTLMHRPETPMPPTAKPSGNFGGVAAFLKRIRNYFFGPPKPAPTCQQLLQSLAKPPTECMRPIPVTVTQPTQNMISKRKSSRCLIIPQTRLGHGSTSIVIEEVPTLTEEENEQDNDE